VITELTKKLDFLSKKKQQQHSLFAVTISANNLDSMAATSA
jgi:hypothetical protein